tara:strand:+ start:2412 stop:3383 length:972 start_codon:yes stop_codon:yes gene_type:complete
MNIIKLHKNNFNSKNKMKDEILIGLKDNPKYISSKYFYDEKGSKIFDSITKHKDYYLTNKEVEVLNRIKNKLPKLFNENKIDIIELGPGDGSKSKIIIDGFLSNNYEVTYYPIDISIQALKDSKYNLKKNKKLKVRGIHSEFIEGLNYVKTKSRNKKLILFLGSNIGNFNKRDSRDFINKIINGMNIKDNALIGFDLKKDEKILTKAYNDSDFLTKEFNLNLLIRINNIFNANIDLKNFDHIGIYNKLIGAMESFLISLKPQKIFFSDINTTIELNEGEKIHVEYSYKYNEVDIKELLKTTGDSNIIFYYDKMRYFADVLLTK